MRGGCLDLAGPTNTEFAPVAAGLARPHSWMDGHGGRGIWLSPGSGLDQSCCAEGRSPALLPSLLLRGCWGSPELNQGLLMGSLGLGPYFWGLS